MITLTCWISDPDYPECFMRIVEGSDPLIIQNRVAFIEKTPRIRISSTEWKYGNKGCGQELGSFQPSRDWCDNELLRLGYYLRED